MGRGTVLEDLGRNQLVFLLLVCLSVLHSHSVIGFVVVSVGFDGRGVPLSAFLNTPCIFAQTEHQVTSVEIKKNLLRRS